MYAHIATHVHVHDGTDDYASVCVMRTVQIILQESLCACNHELYILQIHDNGNHYYIVYVCIYCDTRKINFIFTCMYTDGSWAVDLPAEEVPPEVPEPALGINFASQYCHNTSVQAIEFE